jgi:hypothetical protein
MLRPLLAAGLLCALAALAPTAQAADPICVSEGLGDTTINTLVCGPGGEAVEDAAWTAGRPDCLLNTAPNQWVPVCTSGAPSTKPYTGAVSGYVLCYGNTPPFQYLDRCFGT